MCGASLCTRRILRACFAFGSGARENFETTRKRLWAAALLGALLSSCTSSEAGDERFDVIEATIPEMQRAMEEGRVTSRALVEAHLLRIAFYEEEVNAAMVVKWG